MRCYHCQGAAEYHPETRRFELWFAICTQSRGAPCGASLACLLFCCSRAVSVRVRLHLLLTRGPLCLITLALSSGTPTRAYRFMKFASRRLGSGRLRISPNGAPQYL